jgi:dipeptidyl aminopeptidase/acylaminoacyl peptidase
MNLQLLATRGYAVFYPDAPQEKGTPLMDLAKAVLPGVQRVIDMGIADPKHIGILGYSYGGYSVLALLVQSKRFSAAVDVAGITDLTDSYAKSGAGGGGIEWVEEGQGQIGGSVWQYRDRFIENSPFFYLDRIETPILIIHGSIDTIPVLESRLAFGGLRRLGKQVVYVEYQGEEHVPALWAYSNQIDFYNRVIAWFDGRLKNH